MVTCPQTRIFHFKWTSSFTCAQTKNISLQMDFVVYLSTIQEYFTSNGLRRLLVHKQEDFTSNGLRRLLVHKQEDSTSNGLRNLKSSAQYGKKSDMKIAFPLRNPQHSRFESGAERREKFQVSGLWDRQILNKNRTPSTL